MTDSTYEPSLPRMLAELLGDATKAMNHAVLIAATDGSPKAMEFIADWLNGHDAVDGDTHNAVVDALAGRTFPPDGPVAAGETEG